MRNSEKYYKGRYKHFQREMILWEKIEPIQWKST